MNKGRLLIIDNRPDHIKPRREFLNEAGYEVWEAHTPERGRKKLETGLVHLAIVDVRLWNDDDPNDWSGLELVEEVHTEYPDFPVLILTAFPSYEAVQRARRPGRNSLPSARDFVYKDEGLQKLVQAVDTAFAKDVKINPGLRIEFSGSFSFLCMVSMIDSHAQKESQDKQAQDVGKGQTLTLTSAKQVRGFLERSQELRDLFCRLFHDRERITIYPPLPGRGDAVVVQVRPGVGDEDQQPVIAKVGKRQLVEDEARRFDGHVCNLIGTWTTQKVGPKEEPTARTMHFAGIVYTIAGGELDDTERFRDFYRATSDAEQICRVLTNLFNHLQRWYQAPPKEKTGSLAAVYRQELGFTKEHHSREKFAKTLVEVCTKALPLGLEYSSGKLYFRVLGKRKGPYPDPTPYLYEDLKTFATSWWECTTHGDFHGENLLVDQEHNGIWLIDFSRAGRGPALRDFAELESVIKFDLLSGRVRDLTSLYRFEEKLLATTTLEQIPEPDKDMPDELKKTLHVVRHLRKLASTVPQSNIRDYFVGLLFYAAWMIVAEGASPPSPGQSRPTNVRKMHALLSATMLCDKLEKLKDDKGIPLPMP